MFETEIIKANYFLKNPASDWHVIDWPIKRHHCQRVISYVELW